MLSARAQRGRRVRALTNKADRYKLTRAEAELFVHEHEDDWPGDDLVNTVRR